MRINEEDNERVKLFKHLYYIKLIFYGKIIEKEICFRNIK